MGLEIYIFLIQVNMTDGDRPGLDIDLHNGLVKASCELLKALQNVLRPSPMHGRRHYLFTLKDITTCFQVKSHLCEIHLKNQWTSKLSVYINMINIS